jgi:mycothiol synthase
LTAELVVHPALRGHRLGTRLIAGIVELAGEEGAQQLHLWAYGNSAQARELASTFGFVPERTLLQYVLPAERLPRQAEMRVRGFDPQADAEAWLALHNRVFAGHPEQGSWDMADLQARFAQAWFDPADLLIAEDEASGALLGFCWVKLPREPTLPGEIYIVGLAPDARGRGLGRKLVVAGLAHIQARGRPGAMLYVEADNAAAIALYEALGFQACFEHVCYERVEARQR